MYSTPKDLLVFDQAIFNHTDQENDYGYNAYALSGTWRYGIQLQVYQKDLKC
jgi:hypothetical protein